VNSPPTNSVCRFAQLWALLPLIGLLVTLGMAGPAQAATSFGYGGAEGADEVDVTALTQVEGPVGNKDWVNGETSADRLLGAHGPDLRLPSTLVAPNGAGLADDVASGVDDVVGGLPVGRQPNVRTVGSDAHCKGYLTISPMVQTRSRGAPRMTGLGSCEQTGPRLVYATPRVRGVGQSTLFTLTDPERLCTSNEE